MCGFTAAAERRRWWRREAGLDELDRRLAESHETCNRRTWSSAVYAAYVRLSLEHWTAAWDEVSRPRHQKLRFHVYQRQ